MDPLSAATVLQLILLHTLDGREVHVNPRHVVSVSEARTDNLLAKETNCTVTLLSGRFITVTEDCGTVRQRLQQIEKDAPR